jgi:DNA-binding MarR family transcriptional regulator
MSRINRFFDVLQLLRSRVNRELPIQQAMLLLAVAERPGVTMPELMRNLDMPQGTVSRNVKALSHSVSLQNGIVVPRGYGLLRTMPAVDNRHVLAVYLTGRGEALVEEVVRLLDDGLADGSDAVASFRCFAQDSQRLSH